MKVVDLVLRRIGGSLVLLLLGFCAALPMSLVAQVTGSLHGQVQDPSGAVVPGAAVTLRGGGQVLDTQSGADGGYSFRGIPAGTYTLGVQAQGFAPYSQAGVAIVAGQLRQSDVSLAIEVEQQKVTVTGEANTVGLRPDQNGSAIILKGSDLDALSDDPTELSNELQALAGSAAGPDGGQIYIDGFTGGQLPPKSAIREIRINANPFSAEFPTMGYGRIEILTKAGSNKLSGQITSIGTDSAWNTANPLVPEQPNYYLDITQGNVSGPLAKDVSYFLTGSARLVHNQSIVNAVNPQDIATNLQEIVANPSTGWEIEPRIDFEVGKNNTATLRYIFNRSIESGNGVGALSLPEQAYDIDNQENTIQAGDTMVVNSRLLNEIQFRWRRLRNNRTAQYGTPAVTVQGAFTTGGSTTGVVEDHQDFMELHDYWTAAAGNHTLRFGTMWRSYRDANYSTAGSNGSYIFQSTAHYLAKTPDQYSVTIINNPLARALVVDGAFFYQDDWKWKPNVTFSYGLRVEGQSRIHDLVNWAPRVAVAWAPGRPGKTPPKTVLRAGYGWFYSRFTRGQNDAPLILLKTIHGNGINQHNYVIDNPDFYDPTTAASSDDLVGGGATIPIVYTLDPHFHAALAMQFAVGIDHQLAKGVTFNATYLQERAIHAYNSNNVTAPSFDPSTYAIVGSKPAVYNYQFQSAGTWKEQQIIASSSARLKKTSFTASYTFTDARSDTQNYASFFSVPQQPSLDFGRPSWANRQRFFSLASYTMCYGITIAPYLNAVSGSPYNITIGGDLTGNNQFNARPTYGICGAPGVVSTRYGCLDSNPVGKGEKIVPYGLGTGPASAFFNLRISKVIGVGPRIKGENIGGGSQGGRSVQNGGLGGGQARPRLDASVARKYKLSLAGGAINVFNKVNLAAPNGVVLSPLFGESQEIVSNTGLPGNRVLYCQVTFNF